MLGGGHFAGAVFEGANAVAHKTFHCYTVRAKQGGSQSSADNRSGTSHPKSAGASLRRYNQVSSILITLFIPHCGTKQASVMHFGFFSQLVNV